ncbi:MAG: Flp pilus assembly complex ATPase component TadA [Gemmatimonadota bacterium]|nr:Flp pilus assembly complex ATPase component TadA [Gemmatimonadota bacterium]
MTLFPTRMAHNRVRDDWLLPSLAALLPAEELARLEVLAPESYWEAAVGGGQVSDEELVVALAERFRMRIANFDIPTSDHARELIPESLARKHRIVPLAATDAVLEIASANPNDFDAERALAFATGRKVQVLLAPPSRIAERIDELYRPENVVERILQGVSDSYDVQELTDPTDATTNLDITVDGASERPIMRLVDVILAEGITSRASDIHIAAEEQEIAVHYRIDGVLRQVMTLPRAVGVPLVSRMKIMSGLDIADRLRPQDGRARVAVNGVPVDLRVSTLPAAHGEKVVIRILDQRSMVLELDRMGLHPEELVRLNTLLGLREGFVLVTGPTGSGKTTTLYAGLRRVQERHVNIITVEDPVEYRIPGIAQVQTHEKAGLTFAVALRSIMRQDPDVVLVGEIRDRETAGIAVQAALTGHLVLSTLHTIDAASSITRLTDIGVDSYKIAAALKGIVAQRLVRRLCPHCKERSTDPVHERVRRWIPAEAAVHRAVGCQECGATGYRGRVAVVEILTVTREVERRIAGNEPTGRIAEAARAGGMRTLWESGVAHVLAGVTSVDEIVRVLDIPLESGAVEGDVPRVAAGGRAVGEAFELIEELTPVAVGAAVAPNDITVLLVENEAPMRRVLRDVLKHEGFHVVEATNGATALAEVDRSAPDVVVLALALPQVDGYEVLRRLRARAATADVRVLVLTAQGDEESEVRVFEAGADDFIAKPFRPRVLTARIRSLVRRR